METRALAPLLQAMVLRKLLLELGDLGTLCLVFFPHLAFFRRCLVGRFFPMLDGS